MKFADSRHSGLCSPTHNLASILLVTCAHQPQDPRSNVQIPPRAPPSFTYLALTHAAARYRRLRLLPILPSSSSSTSHIVPHHHHHHLTPPPLSAANTAGLRVCVLTNAASTTVARIQSSLTPLVPLSSHPAFTDHPYLRPNPRGKRPLLLCATIARISRVPSNTR
ncbi:hypothetical protein Landi51_00637 [Colletotrichum acutatum]